MATYLRGIGRVVSREGWLTKKGKEEEEEGGGMRRRRRNEEEEEEFLLIVCLLIGKLRSKKRWGILDEKTLYLFDSPDGK